MRTLTRILALCLAVLAGCTAAGPTPDAASPPPAEPSSPLGSPFAGRAHDALFGGAPLILDRGDLRLGTTVHFPRIPSRQELNDLHYYTGLAHVVLTLPAWPAEYAPLQQLEQLPEESDLIVILPGYPPSRAAAEAWNLLSSRVRIVVVVNAPPPSVAVVDDLNLMRGLERVIAQLDDPRRTGFERLQRPLGFRKVID